MKNSILSPNAPSDANIAGSIVDAGHNIDSDLQHSLTNSTSRNGMNPGLGPLANNGGPTPTMALLPGSPAINAADPTDFPATDQRGELRPYGPAPDIGAFEYIPFSFPPITISGQILGLMSTDQVTVTLGDSSTLTTNLGAYSLQVSNSSSDILSPSSASYAFVPSSRIISFASNQANVNFHAYTTNAPYYSLATNTLVEGNIAGSDGIFLTVTPTAPWTATANDFWLHLTAAYQSGIGSTNVVFSFDANPGSMRSGTLTIAGQTLTVTQAAAVFILGTNALAEAAPAGSDSVVLTASSQVASWMASANAAWLHLDAANQSGAGSTNVVFSFDANAGATRSGTLAIASQTVTVTQAAPAFVLGTNAIFEGPLAGNDSVVLTANLQIAL